MERDVCIKEKNTIHICRQRVIFSFILQVYKKVYKTFSRLLISFATDNDRADDERHNEQHEKGNEQFHLKVFPLHPFLDLCGGAVEAVRVVLHVVADIEQRLEVVLVVERGLDVVVHHALHLLHLVLHVGDLVAVGDVGVLLYQMLEQGPAALGESAGGRFAHLVAKQLFKICARVGKQLESGSLRRICKLTEKNERGVGLVVDVADVLVDDGEAVVVPELRALQNLVKLLLEERGRGRGRSGRRHDVLREAAAVGNSGDGDVADVGHVGADGARARTGACVRRRGGAAAVRGEDGAVCRYAALYAARAAARGGRGWCVSWGYACVRVCWRPTCAVAKGGRFAFAPRGGVKWRQRAARQRALEAETAPWCNSFRTACRRAAAVGASKRLARSREALVRGVAKVEQLRVCHVATRTHDRTRDRTQDGAGG
ncbi:a-agglutinin anchorage subunit [Gracilaria domingensis]|nr:a-agglutinin anchorage subunit [Gracilaria domingensis]